MRFVCRNEWNLESVDAAGLVKSSHCLCNWSSGPEMPLKRGRLFFLFIEGGESFKPLIDHEVIDQDTRKITAMVI